MESRGGDVCANCGAIRMQHSVGLYRMWCPDERQPDKLPDGRWKLGAKPLSFQKERK